MTEMMLFVFQGIIALGLKTAASFPLTRISGKLLQLFKTHYDYIVTETLFLFHGKNSIVEYQ